MARRNFLALAFHSSGRCHRRRGRRRPWPHTGRGSAVKSPRGYSGERVVHIWGRTHVSRAQCHSWSGRTGQNTALRDRPVPDRLRRASRRRTCVVLPTRMERSAQGVARACHKCRLRARWAFVETCLCDWWQRVCRHVRAYRPAPGVQSGR